MSWVSKAKNVNQGANRPFKSKSGLEFWKEAHSAPFGGSKEMDKAVGWDTSDQEEKMKQQRKEREKEMAATKDILGGMDKFDQDYLGEMGQLKKQATNQAKDARNIYSNDIQPRQKQIMEDAQRRAGDAMTLQDAGDVNNSVHQGVRKLYDDQAQGVRKQSLADVGVLNSLGAQATAQQMGSAGAPVTGSQLQLMNAGNQQQSGLAYARAQQQMQRLREQGLERGFSESAAQYDRGQGAKDRYNQSIGNYEQGMDNNINRQRDFRGEIGGFSGVAHGVNTGSNARDLAYTQNLYGGKREDLNAQIALGNAQNAQRSAVVGAGVGAIGSLVGGYYGGQGGAQAGGQMGKGVQPATAPTQQQQGQQSYNQTDYGNGQQYGQRPNPYEQDQQQQQNQRYYG